MTEGWGIGSLGRKELDGVPVRGTVAGVLGRHAGADGWARSACAAVDAVGECI